MVLLSISLCLKHAYSLSPMQNQMGSLPVHTGSDPRCGWFGFGTETNMHVWYIGALALNKGTTKTGRGTIYVGA